MASNSQASSIPIPDSTMLPGHKPDKRRRRTSQRSRRPSSNMLVTPSPEFESSQERSWSTAVENGHETTDEQHSSIPIASSSKAAGKAVTPYLTKYVPQTYNPVGGQQSNSRSMEVNPNPSTKYCNRHRPDVKCRRQADEESMDQLQNELATLSNDDQQGIAHVWSLFSAAPAKQRNLMLRGILSVCCFPQLSYISSSIRDLIKIDFLSLLPPEIAFNILCFLDTTSLCKAAQVCRKWRELSDDDVVWHRMCEQHIDRKCTKCGWGLPLLERKRLRNEKRQIQLRASGRGLNEWSPEISPLPESPPLGQQASTLGQKRSLPGDDEPIAPESKRLCSQHGDSRLETRRPWKDVYKARFKVGTNWKYGRCSIKVLRGHTNGVMCLQLRDNILATGSYDATIKIWNLDTMTEERTLRGHTRGIRCLQFDDVRLMSGSIDGTIRVWNWKTGECQRVLNPEKGGILSLNFVPRYLCAGTMENVVRVWSLCDKTMFTLHGHTDFVNAVKVDAASRTVFSASDDLTVKIWDLDTRRCLKTISGHVGQVQQLYLVPPETNLDFHTYFTNLDQDTETDNDQELDDISSDAPKGPRRATPPPLVNTSFYPDQPDRPNPPQYMLTASLDNTLRLWHVPTGRCLRKFFGHVEGVWALAADSLRVVSGAEDRMIKVWDWNGKCESTYTGHTGPVTCIGLSGERLISGGEDCEIRVLEFGTDRHDCVQNVEE